MSNEARVIEIFKETDVLLEGHFLLTSGRHSNQYMQCAKILQYPNYTQELMGMLADKYKDDKIDYVLAPAVGGIIIGYELARQLGAKNMFAERDEDGSMVFRRGFELPKGARVVVAEDVITTGGSVQEVIDIAKEAGAVIVGVAVLVDRSSGTANFDTRLDCALVAKVESWEKDECPICKAGTEELVKPGSRKIK